jgi:predicted nucleic acid-binding protein
MYLSGPLALQKDQSRDLLQRCFQEEERLVTDAEVLQEILHGYAAIGRKKAIQPAFETLLGIVDEIFPIEARDVDRAKAILFATDRLSARDALHLALMERHSVSRILSFDRGFDGYPGIKRIGP